MPPGISLCPPRDSSSRLLAAGGARRARIGIAPGRSSLAKLAGANVLTLSLNRRRRPRNFFTGGLVAWNQFPLAPDGSAVAASRIARVSRIPGSMESWWIAPNGSVQGAYWYEGSNWGRYELAPAGSASPGGGIAAVSRIPGQTSAHEGVCGRHPDHQLKLEPLPGQASSGHPSTPSTANRSSSARGSCHWRHRKQRSGEAGPPRRSPGCLRTRTAPPAAAISITGRSRRGGWR